MLSTSKIKSFSLNCSALLILVLDICNTFNINMNFFFTYLAMILIFFLFIAVLLLTLTNYVKINYYLHIALYIFILYFCLYYSNREYFKCGTKLSCIIATLTIFFILYKTSNYNFNYKRFFSRVVFFYLIAIVFINDLLNIVFIIINSIKFNFLFERFIIDFIVICVLTFLFILTLKNKNITLITDFDISLTDILDIFISCGFFIITLIYYSAFLIYPFHNQKVNDWVPILIISVSFFLTLLGYKKKIEKIFSIYMILWIIIPVILFIIYIQIVELGGKEAFHSLFLFVTALDAFILVLISDDMQRKVHITIENKSIVSLIKIFLANITLVVSLVTGIFGENNNWKAFIKWLCNELFLIGRKIRKLSNINISNEFKNMIFLVCILIIIILFSFLLIKLEKKVSKFVANEINSIVKNNV